MFMADMSNVIIYIKVYSSGSIPVPGGWKQPIGWSGSGPVLYWSLDNLEGLVLMEGMEQKDFDAIADGKVKKAIRFDYRKSQWADLGVQTDACLVVPETCGPEGAAVAFWVKIDACIGIMASFADNTGFMIFCYPDLSMVFWVGLLDGVIVRIIPKVEEDQWIHLVLNYKGTVKAIEVFKDGALVPGQSTTSIISRSPGEGRLVLGKRETNRDNYYCSVDLDELIFFNRKLTVPEVETIYNKDK